ncbi:phosphoribosyltransferase family protein [Bacillus massiliglaciei]|uniref:phosphoribosyltransferase family protein n=1 Tax=Bacillus massiliglaciei TaxID=1816693 RepID=UPI000DA62DBA|nr:phosphoribosyltransferase family protein [Bacillus massiliglaciei]
MSKFPISTYLPNQNTYTYNILDTLKIELEVRDNPYHLPLEVLFEMAARKNKKRAFLFVSKILGKHIPVKPAASLLSGALLGLCWQESASGIRHPKTEEAIQALIKGEGEEAVYDSLMDEPILLPEETLFIGFAETATSLGHSVFDLFGHAKYIHTTRERVVGLSSAIEFEEEHSHATEQFCYGDEAVLKKSGPIVLVDDEITTGKTALNIIRSIHSQYPRDRYIVLSLLDWRSEANRQSYRDLERELGITIETAALLAGEITVDGQSPELEGGYQYPEGGEKTAAIRSISLSDSLIEKKIADIPYSSVTASGIVHNIPYSGMTGRFHGIPSESRQDIAEFARAAGGLLKDGRTDGKALCLGTGEFMYLPMKIASYMGDNVFYHSTTRSPIHRIDREGYAIRSGFAFPNHDDSDVANFVYNIPYGEYSDIYLFIERKANQERLAPMLDELKRAGAKQLTVVTLNE